ncbi:MAG: 2,3-bisphosphoglycerate-independent phosphoglycerate mutase [Thermoguttaceae bacterium]|nr:2,3-bisphosphoglycerate-independent phosphoglycerate mutase [Thermoguttaceae bacterium]
MEIQDLVKRLKQKNDSKVVLFVSDGIGGLAQQPGGKTELETAATPNLDRLAKIGVLGSSIPIKPGITPGSGPGHLGIFGYDPLKHEIGRGVLEATGIGFPVGSDDVCIRCNFCTLDANRNITDRRAGRIPTPESAPLAESLNAVKIPGVEIFVKPVQEHRFAVVFRAAGLGGNVYDTDPQKTGVPPLDPVAMDANDTASLKTVEVAKEFVRQAEKILAGQPKANGLTLRGFAKKPNITPFEEVTGMRPAAIAVYPMYKGLASLVGMTIEGMPKTIDEEINVLEQVWDKYDFFFIHWKYTDSRGEDGNFDEKVKMIEKYDEMVARIEKLGPTVFCSTGDHSTPAVMAGHSFHPVPVLVAGQNVRTDACQCFGETECLKGGLGMFEAMYLMPQLMAFAGRLAKFGA